MAMARDAELAVKLAAFWRWPEDEGLDVTWGPAYAPHLLTVDGVHLSTQTLRAWVGRDWMWRVTDAEGRKFKTTRPTRIGLTEVGRRVIAKEKSRKDA